MKKYILRTLPYLVMPVFTPFYILLDKVLLVDIFGCGCVPSTQTNMLNIPFNANDLRWTVYFLLTIGMTFLGLRFSKALQHKWTKIVYVAGIPAFNLILTFWICRMFMWA